MSQSETSPSSSLDGPEAPIHARLQSNEEQLFTLQHQVTALLPLMDQRLMDLAVTVLEGQQQATSCLLAQLEQQMAELRTTTSEFASRTSSEVEASLREVLTALTERAAASAIGSVRPSESEDSTTSDASLSRLDLSIATLRTELLQEIGRRPESGGPSTNQELLDELRSLWRKQEVYTLGLRSALKKDLEEMHLDLRSQVHKDAKAEQEVTRTALAGTMRQALSGRPPTPREAPTPPVEPRRTPIGGIVILSSVTSVVVTLGLSWLTG